VKIYGHKFIFRGKYPEGQSIFNNYQKFFFVATIHAYVGGASGKNEREKIRKING
jgi:hypothetical protein